MGWESDCSITPTDHHNSEASKPCEENGSGFPGRNWLASLLQRHSSSVQNFDDNDILNDKALAVAPMVDQSDLPFRLLCRKYGANLCFTPMVHARLFLGVESYRDQFWDQLKGTPEIDRPLIVQFCGDDPAVLLEAARYVHQQCDAVDLNCGCPQGIAKRGNYGAFLLEQEDRLVDCVKTLSSNLACPICVKVRLLPTGIENSLRLYERLVDAGASLLTVHGRNRHQKGYLTSAADWTAIRRVVETVGKRVPIISNGSIACLEDARECLSVTGADGVMSAEAVLEYPPLFQLGMIGPSGQRHGPGRLHIAREYLSLCEKFPPHRGGQGSQIKCARMHIHKFLHDDLQMDLKLRDLAIESLTYEDLWKLLEAVEILQRRVCHIKKDERLSWYYRYRPVDEKGTGTGETVGVKTPSVPYQYHDLDDDAAGCMAALFGD